ncbi:unnamed protein product [Ceutorhynchus assimilis]|uniref:Inter-alpha-trypsin inhibitor heavy chain H4-like n=1 Tax=Ceutorhynchus assimilis TaxID=467358 RepID=A0A9P0DE87_9CUCU|nr:unnamed protein product [Ceutorhynchus assimilis]
MFKFSTLVGALLLCVALSDTAHIQNKRSLVVSSTEPPKAEADKNTIPSVPSVPKIYEMRVDTNVSNRYAKTVITSKVKNLDSKAQEATFSIVTPDQAFISGFVMEIDGKKYEAYVQEKEEAKQTYDQAVFSGHSAAHVAVSARDSNRFTVSVNVEPESKAIFYLTYEELLLRKDEKYDIVLNIHPGQPVKNLEVKVNIMESRPLKFVKTPSLRSGNEVSKNSPNIDPEAEIQNVNETAAVVTFSPDVARQKVLGGSLGGKEQDGLSGQFIVQYDVERDPQGGEVLVDGGYFVHFFSPEELRPMKKQVVFVLDTSGSMFGTRITQLKEAMDSILSELKPEDVFSIVEFNTVVKVWNVPLSQVTFTKGDEAYFAYEPTTERTKPKEQHLPPSVPANQENIDKAKKVIKEWEANGGTDIESALKIALRVVAKSNNDKNVQPMIVFLTDGEPTVGNSVPEQITSAITELNTHKVPIFSLSFGDGADRAFLQKISLKNQGFARHIYEAADAYLQLENFYKQISSPLLANVTFKYVDKVKNVTKTHFPVFFKGSELYVTGIIDPGFIPPPAECWSSDGLIQLKPTVYNSVGSLERLWAYLTVKQLLEQREIAEDKKGPTQEALRLALKYSFVTDVSSLVVVKPNASSAVSTEDASKVSQPGQYGIPAIPLSGTPGGVASYSLGFSGGSRKGSFRRGYVSAFRRPMKYGSLLRGGSAGGFASNYYQSSMMHSRYPAPIPPVAPASYDADDLIDIRHEVDSEDGVYYSTPRLPLTSTTTSENPLFNLLPWLRQNVVGQTLLVEGVSYDMDGLVTAQPECSNSFNTTNGICTLLKNCPQVYPDLVDFDTYTKHACVVENHAGVCCPKPVQVEP